MSLLGKRQKFISASHLRYYFENDGLNYWLKYCNKQQVFNKNTNYNFFDWLMEQGIEYEKKVIKNLKKRFDIVDDITFTKERKYKMVSQAYLKCDNRRMQGYADLVIHSSQIKRLLKNLTAQEQEFIKKQDLTKNFYVVADVKMSNIKINKDGFLNNDSKMKYYKSQLYFYRELVDNTVPFSLIISKNKTENYTGNSLSKGSLYSISIINWEKENFEDTFKDAFSFCFNILDNGDKWKIGKRVREELKPNMNVAQTPLGKEIAERTGEITKLWRCGVKHRTIAKNNGFSSYKNKKLRAKHLGFKGKNEVILDAILKSYRSTKKVIIEEKEGIPEKCDKEYYVDFEYCYYKDTTINFMIGVGYEEDGEWKFRCFYANKLSGKEEERIYREFIEFVGDHPCYHWSQAEPNTFKAGIAKYGFSNTPNFIDILPVFRDNRVIFKNQFNFGLKEVSKCAYEQGFIKTQWENSIYDGMSAVTLVLRTVGTKEFKNTMEEVAKYNEVDCKVMWELLGFLRSK